MGRCNLDGQPLSEHDRAAVDAFARFLEAQARRPEPEVDAPPEEADTDG